MAKSCKHGGYAFGEFTLDPEKRMLYRGDAEIPLPPKVVETLTVLVENQGEIVSKDDLMEKVWADAIVEESNLSQHLYILRKTLGDTASGRPVIETLRRRGYRFNAGTTVLAAATEPGMEYSPRSSAAHLSVRRVGNVLQVADWEAAPTPTLLPGNASPVYVDAVNIKTRWPIGAYVAVGILTAGLMVSGYWFWSNQNAAKGVSAGDIQTTFLTNGRPVEGLAISPDGNYFVYHEIETPVARLWLQQTGQSNRVEIVPAAERWIGQKTFSPDGQFVYFVAQEKGDKTSSLYRVPTLGGLYTKVLENVSTPVTFSPDGKEMAFVRQGDETTASELVVVSSDGSVERTVLSRTGKQSLSSGSAWSPDGRLIAFASIELDDQRNGRALPSAIELSSGEVTSISPEKWDNCYRMQWTVDGRGLVFIGTRDGENNSSRRDQVYYLSYPEGKARKLTNEGNRHEPSSLAVTANDEILVLPQGRSSQIWAMEANGDSRTAVQITKGLLDGRAGIAPLPDGRIGYITRTGENVNVWIMNADGSGQRQLTSEPSFVEELRASPDGAFFVFSGVKDRRNHLFRINPEGRDQVQITTGDGYEVDSSVSPDGAWITYGVYGKSFIWKIPSGGGQPEPLSSIKCSSPHFSPDGSLISCIREGNNIAILRAADGNVRMTLEPHPLSKLNFGARWMPDGKSLVYISTDEGTANLWLQPADGGAPARLTDFTGGDIYNFAFSTDGSRIFLARGHPIHDAMLIKDFR